MDRYGVIETNGIDDDVRRVRDLVHASGVTVDLADKRLVRITRLRLVTDRDVPFWDLSYCYGLLDDGTHCRVRLPEHQWRKSNLTGDLIGMCKRAGRYGKGLGLFDPLVVSKLYG